MNNTGKILLALFGLYTALTLGWLVVAIKGREHYKAAYEQEVRDHTATSLKLMGCENETNR